MVTENDYASLEKEIKQICKANLPFERLDLTKEQALDMFESNKYKIEFI